MSSRRTPGGLSRVRSLAPPGSSLPSKISASFSPLSLFPLQHDPSDRHPFQSTRTKLKKKEKDICTVREREINVARTVQSNSLPRLRLDFGEKKERGISGRQISSGFSFRSVMIRRPHRGSDLTADLGRPFFAMCGKRAVCLLPKHEYQT